MSSSGKVDRSGVKRVPKDVMTVVGRKVLVTRRGAVRLVAEGASEETVEIKDEKQEPQEEVALVEHKEKEKKKKKKKKKKSVVVEKKRQARDEETKDDVEESYFV